ncbi:MAG: hypothetical protein UW68_C0035G0005 [Candidatus Collierbacteria bacterium GW2011_GWB1_44_6]|uniref:Uncharacterized protein n=1 Tax=Candidatus Collierbacteria bacterium GW2011_GWB1_44_6 TaxID=1618384 RepID=A0A0G1JMB0_9BACT|nr:MAG: hypothetical protein UW68_C0035G0005 [Candidatus Collierbacteria bacterium GW2011_GWB1_44_6]
MSDGEKQEDENHVELSEVSLGFLKTTKAMELCKKKNLETSPELIDLAIKSVGRLEKITKEVAEKNGLIIDKEKMLGGLFDTLDEAHGNFGRDKVSFSDFLGALADENFQVDVNVVDPLEYFSEIGNIASVSSMKGEIDRIREEFPGESAPEEVATKLINYIDENHHVGVDHDMYLRDLSRGKDHNKTMKYLLKNISLGEALCPSFVGKYAEASVQYGNGMIGAVLDGTHRVAAALVTGQKLLVIEVDMDKVILRNNT